MKRKISIQGRALVLTLALSATTSATADNVEQRTQAAMEVAQSFMMQLGKTMKGQCMLRTSAKDDSRYLPKPGLESDYVTPCLVCPMYGNKRYWHNFRLASEPNGRYFRFAKAIGVKPQCLTCHGSKNDIPSAVKQKLHQQYPFDRATDYRTGDLRGAVSIKQPLPSM